MQCDIGSDASGERKERRSKGIKQSAEKIEQVKKKHVSVLTASLKKSSSRLCDVKPSGLAHKLNNGCQPSVVVVVEPWSCQRLGLACR